MSVYKRGKRWWYEFKFEGQRIRASTKSKSKEVAERAERLRRAELEHRFNRIPERRANPPFDVAAEEWLAEKAGLAAKSRLGYAQRLKHVRSAFKKCLVADVNVERVVRYRSARLDAGASKRTINYEVCCIRGVLKRYGLWAAIAERINKLRENHDVGRALSAEHESQLLAACAKSQAPSLLPLFVFARDTGLRASEMKSLRRCDLRLGGAGGVIVSGEVVVPRSKTDAGTGRSVPLSADICSTLTLWLSRFHGATTDSFVFPRHKVQMIKGGKESKIVGVLLSKPVQSWDHAWRSALKSARLHYRWHDLRHTFISRLAENPIVSEQTIRALAGHVSKQMLERYSHIRVQAKQEAIAALQLARIRAVSDSPQKSPQLQETQEDRTRITH